MTTIPADLIPGVLTGWAGPVEWLHKGAWLEGMVHYRDTNPDPASNRLDLTRPEAAWRVCVVLAAGVRCACPPCEHEEGYTEPDTNALICRVCDDAGGAWFDERLRAAGWLLCGEGK